MKIFLFLCEDARTLEFYPSMFFSIADLVTYFGQLVYDRLGAKVFWVFSKQLRFNSNEVKLFISLIQITENKVNKANCAFLANNYAPVNMSVCFKGR